MVQDALALTQASHVQLEDTTLAELLHCLWDKYGTSTSLQICVLAAREGGVHGRRAMMIRESDIAKRTFIT